MRRTLALLLLLFLGGGALGTGAVADEPPADNPGLRTYDALLPDTRPVDDDDETPGRPRWVATRVVDAATGKPLPGALLEGYPEDISPRTHRYAVRLCVGTANEDGVAWVRIPDGAQVDHWLVRARGRAPAYAFGWFPEPTTLLGAGVPVAGRLAGPLGAPLAGAAVHAWCGCPHGPVVAHTTTDAEGRFALPALDPATTSLWCDPPRGAADELSIDEVLLDALRQRPTCVAPGRVLEGRVVDDDGNGIADAVVRVGGLQGDDDEPHFQRGPATRTDASGRFVLRGVGAPDEASSVIAALANGAQWSARIPPLDAPRLVIDRFSQMPGPDAETGVLVLRAEDATGAPVPRLPHLVAIAADGQRMTLEPQPGLANELGVGRWTVVRLGHDPAFRAVTIVPFQVDIAAGARVERTVRLVDQPRVALLADAVSPEADLVLQTAHAARGVTLSALVEGRIHVAADLPAHLLVDGVSHPLGPVTNGRRIARPPGAPRPHRVRLRAPFAVEDVAVAWRGLSLDHLEVPEDGWLVLDVRAAITLLVEDEEGAPWRVALDLSGEGRDHEVDLAAVGTPPPPEVEATLAWPNEAAGQPARASYDAFAPGATESDHGGTEIEPPIEELLVGGRIVLRAEGFSPLALDVAPGTNTVRWPAGVLTVEAFGPDGRRVRAMLLVAGHLHPDDGQQPLRLRGLPPGPTRVVATPIDPALRGVVRTIDVGAAGAPVPLRFTAR